MEASVYHTEARVAGRCLVEAPEGEGPFPLIVGFHGYGQCAEDELPLLAEMTGGAAWIRCAVEALHPFYPGGGAVGASWMTARRRDRMIGENVRYVDAVLAELVNSYPSGSVLVYHGFSQGAAMACRAALLCSRRPSAVMLLGGDIPPEHADLRRMGSVHIARGDSDRLYPEKVYERDALRLESAGVPFVRCGFAGGHEVASDYLTSAGEFLLRITQR